MRLENELKGERMVTPGIETGPRIVHIDRGSSYPWSEISETGMWTPFAIDAKGGEMKTKGEMQTKGEHAHRGSMSCCHQWQRGILLIKLSLMPTWTCNGPMGCHWCHQVPPCSALDPLQSGLVPWSSLYPVDKVLVPTRMNLEVATLLKTLKTLKIVLKPW